MPNNYPLVQELASDDLGGKTGARRFYVMAVGKGDTDEFPYTVVNEKVSAELGRIIGLPLPEVLLYRLDDRYLAFSHFMPPRKSGEIGPPGTSSQTAAFFLNNPGFLEGMVCFDLFVCNNDRKPDNLHVDENEQTWLIDHGNALFYRPRPRQGVQAGIGRLETVEADLGSLFDLPHAFLGGVKSWEAIDQWCERISKVPDYFIEATVETLPEGVATPRERDFLMEFLNRRKSKIRQLVSDNQSLFASLDVPST